MSRPAASQDQGLAGGPDITTPAPSAHASEAQQLTERDSQRNLHAPRPQTAEYQQALASAVENMELRTTEPIVQDQAEPESAPKPIQAATIDPEGGVPLAPNTYKVKLPKLGITYDDGEADDLPFGFGVNLDSDEEGSQAHESESDSQSVSSEKPSEAPVEADEQANENALDEPAKELSDEEQKRILAEWKKAGRPKCRVDLSNGDGECDGFHPAALHDEAKAIAAKQVRAAREYVSKNMPDALASSNAEKKQAKKAKKVEAKKRKADDEPEAESRAEPEDDGFTLVQYTKGKKNAASMTDNPPPTEAKPTCPTCKKKHAGDCKMCGTCGKYHRGPCAKKGKQAASTTPTYAQVAQGQRPAASNQATGRAWDPQYVLERLASNVENDVGMDNFAYLANRLHGGSRPPHQQQKKGGR